jgi:hypothetical protein
MRKILRSKIARSKKAASKSTKGKKKSGKKSPGKSATRGSFLAGLSRAFDPTRLQIRGHLDEVAFDQLTPGRNFSAADLLKLPPFIPGQIRFRLLRPDDFLVVNIETTDLQFEQPPTGGDGNQPRTGPHLVPSGSQGGLLTAVFGYQHAAEIAIHTVNDVPDLPPQPGEAVPIAARAAHKSRLVFKVPKGEQIPFSIEGIIAAMSRLEMVVAPVATPRSLINFPVTIKPGLALKQFATGIALADQDGQLFLQDMATTRSTRNKATTTASLVAEAQALHDLRARAQARHRLSTRVERLGIAWPPAPGRWDSSPQKSRRDSCSRSQNRASRRPAKPRSRRHSGCSFRRACSTDGHTRSSPSQRRRIQCGSNSGIRGSVSGMLPPAATSASMNATSPKRSSERSGPATLKLRHRQPPISTTTRSGNRLMVPTALTSCGRARRR